MPLAVPNIRPISDLRTNLNDVCEQAQQTQQPIFMTKNGKASLIVIDCEAYKAQQQHDRYVQKLREAEIEAKYRDETFTQEEVTESMQRIFDFWGV
jgi:prevent-host-death family protein